MELKDVVQMLLDNGIVSYDGLRRSADRYFLETVLLRVTELVRADGDVPEDLEGQINAIIFWAAKTDNCVNAAGVMRLGMKEAPEAIAAITKGFAKARAVEMVEEERVAVEMKSIEAVSKIEE